MKGCWPLLNLPYLCVLYYKFLCLLNYNYSFACWTNLIFLVQKSNLSWWLVLTYPSVGFTVILLSILCNYLKIKTGSLPIFVSLSSIVELSSLERIMLTNILMLLSFLHISDIFGPWTFFHIKHATFEGLPPINWEEIWEENLGW